MTGPDDASKGKRLISFDIDGTLEIGEPPGPITLAMVKRAQALGYLVGSCSDRPAGLQRAMWEGLGIAVDFAVLKHKMADARAQLEAGECVHVGTADRDSHYSELSGFTFVNARDIAGQPWAVDEAGAPLAPNTSEFSPTERARLGSA
jgi:hypothetical protein